MIMDKILYYLTKGCVWILSSLPWCVLLPVASFMAFLMRRVFRYRLKVVRRNLSASFPQKSREELRAIEKGFYEYLADYLVFEGKLLTMSYEELRERVVYENHEQFVGMCKTHGSAILMIPHYSFFEGLIGIAAVAGNNVLPVQVYKPLHNKAMDRLFLEIRGRFGSLGVPKHATARTLVKYYRQGQSMVVGLITDQNPNRQEAHYWTTFLNQDTVFMDGAEKFAKMMNWPVFYAEFMHGPRRGYCHVRLDLITQSPREMEEGAIMEIFARRLEQTIQRDPAPWFWSHRRWKYQKPAK